MRKSKYSESQIIEILNEGESGVPIIDICREHGISRSAYYKWKSKYGGMNVNELKHLRELETENRRLKQMYAELSLDHKIMKDIVSKKLWSPTHGGKWQPPCENKETSGIIRKCIEFTVKWISICT